VKHEGDKKNRQEKIGRKALDVAKTDPNLFLLRDEIYKVYALLKYLDRKSASRNC
jgi:hypothetical protein